MLDKPISPLIAPADDQRHDVRQAQMDYVRYVRNFTA
jgi:hypothetical protein